MWELDYRESWAQKNWCFWTVVLEKALENSLDFKDIKPVHPKGDQAWVLTGRTDVEAETPILWPPDAKSWLIWKDPDAGKDWGQVEKGTTEDEMIGWHHRLDGHGFGWTPGVGDGQGGLACCGSWGRKELDTTERLRWTEFIGQIDAEAVTLVLWPPDMNKWLFGKDSDAGKDWRQELGMTENEIVGWHHWCDGHEFEQAMGVGDGQGSLTCYIVHGLAKSRTWLSDRTELKLVSNSLLM